MARFGVGLAPPGGTRAAGPGSEHLLDTASNLDPSGWPPVVAKGALGAKLGGLT